MAEAAPDAVTERVTKNSARVDLDSAEALALAELAYPDSEFTHPATNLAFREAFLRGFQAHASESAARQPSEDNLTRVKKIILESLVFTNENSDPWAQLLAENILAAVPDAATEKLREASEADRIRLGHLQDEVYRLGAERDAALAAIERVRAVAMQHRSVEQHNEMVPVTDIVDLIREQSSADYLAALDGAPEPEWEYSVGFNDPEDGWINDHADIHDNYEDARSDYSEPHWLVEDRVVRRRPAGPWLPVEGES